MKLIVQIPCFNEEAALAATVAEIPRVIPGVARVEILVIDDGSSDRTAEVARAAGVEHVIRHPINRGLARTYQTGIDACLRLGADIIVNTDADGQYAGADIPRLVEPILAGRADLVVGDRQTSTLTHFSPLKRRLQALGSRVIAALSGLDVADAVSGFRALSRQAALQTSILSSFSYTTEQLIQGGKKRLAVVWVPITAHASTRPSRLFKSLPSFIRHSGLTMVRTYAMYQPLRIFWLIGMTLTAAGLVPIGRFLYFVATGDGAGHIQSLILGAVLTIMGFGTLLFGLIAELVAYNRQLLEIVVEKVRRLESEAPAGPAQPPPDAP